MTLKELIAELQKIDPTGERKVLTWQGRDGDELAEPRPYVTVIADRSSLSDWSVEVGDTVLIIA